MMMNPEPQKEHRWLESLVGEWTYETQACAAPGQSQTSEKATGSETVRSLGSLWVTGDGQGDMPGGGTAKMQITLGYDPEKKKFVGTWIGSMMTHMFLYEGELDGSGKVLTLSTVGPSFAGDGKTAKYQDIITIKDADHRLLTSRVQGEDGKWTDFMTASYRRRR
jgi:Protein of unknown function (DUF1579)